MWELGNWGCSHFKGFRAYPKSEAKILGDFWGENGAILGKRERFLERSEVMIRKNYRVIGQKELVASSTIQGK